MPEVVTRRALPSDRRRSGRPDAVLLLMSVVAAAAGVLAWRSMEEAWVQLTITDTSDRLDPVLVGAVTLRGKGALIGAIGQGLSAVLVGSGLLWLVYSFDRGSTMPWFTSPITAIVAGAAGVGASVLSALVWFVWEEAAIGRSSALGLTGDQFREILDRQPPPLVEIQRLTGLMRFGGMMLLGTLVASAAWWAYRKRA